MDNISLLISALDYIEEHLKDTIQTAQIAAACYCSKSTLEKLFHYANRISVHDYILRRRMTLAAKTLAQNPQISILSVALEYGYSTHESFTRAFYSVWRFNPSDIRGKRYPELYPKLVISMKGDSNMATKKHFDISELYDLFQERKNCYFVCCDITRMMNINNVSRKAGDIAILEALRRITEVSGPDDIAFRIGGDEFCILTASADEAYARSLAEKIRSYNNNTITYENRSLPLSLHVGITKYESKGSSIHYGDLFTSLSESAYNG